MGNPTAAQEPSMEEILASIRQIISEDGEGPDDEAPEADGAAEASAEPAESADQADDPSEDEPSSSQASADEPEAEAGDENDDDETGDDAGEAADSELDAIDISGTPDDEEPEPDGTAVGFDTMDAVPHPEEPEADDAVLTGSRESPFDTLQDRLASAVAESDDAEPGHDDDMPELESASHFSEGLQAVHDPEMAENVTQVQPEPQRHETTDRSSEITESQAMTATAPKPAEYTGDDKLISADAGASVANAFSTLTHTILSQNARTLDDLVSDMLQPMLKEWLDENLPTLVERLVKQEIDRMARGGRA